MSIKLPRQQEVVEEAMQLLWQHLPPSKGGSGDFDVVCRGRELSQNARGIVCRRNSCILGSKDSGTNSDGIVERKMRRQICRGLSGSCRYWGRDR